MSRKGKQEGKTTAKQRLSTRQLMNTRRITEYSLETFDGDELVYFMIRPTNLSVLSESSVGARVYALMNVLKGVAEIEMLCLNSRENFEENKEFLRRRAEEERNPVIRQLLERDQNFLDRIQVQMATAREFLIMIRLRNQKGKDVFSYLDRIEKSLKEQGFDSRRADEEDIKRILAVYYEQNVTSEKFEDFDGERWIIPDD
ncbi:hypothetical protein CE91St54_29250 [Hungatella hathewayi]|uniref:Uncharacterized protein n=2 Tax=Hungatella hathewayi TaxID=154046 RepID=A0AA37JT16_9FIRM|nr:hypothetical protein [Hungatella hathewayi]GKH04095.1 hypothetical protein CE91St55_60760 [Hungatella hathewayi]GKH07817.1 hypothetical protein CE91St54_29250 [Hungatella hathewayi]